MKCRKCNTEMERTYEKELYYVGGNGIETLVRIVYKYISTCYTCGHRNIETQDTSKNKDD